jgi:MOSC domain-containing protein YiiM
MPARIHQINLSPGGVPKLPVPEAVVQTTGLVGDDHHDKKHHGGPDRALCLFSLEVINRLRADGHPIAPGTVGENLTLEGLDWPRLTPGTRLAFDRGVELEITSYTNPCSNIRNSFKDLEFRRIRHDLHPGDSRVYARVLREGRIATGETVRVLQSAQA